VAVECVDELIVNRTFGEGRPGPAGP
jgi:hypothetical protein